jgi:hypothetical protein
VVIVFMATRPEIGRVVALYGRMGLVASNHLHTFVFVSGEPVSEAHIRTTGVGCWARYLRTTNHEKQAIGFSLLYGHPVCMCIMHINYHFDAVLVLHTRTASLVDAMGVQTQCTAEGPRPKFGIGVAGFAGGVTEKGRCKVW